MSNTKHTPGVWTVERSETDPRVIWIEGEHTGALGIADLYSKGIDGEIFDKDNAEANAHLIAAAPELLKALEGMVATFAQLTDNLPEENPGEWFQVMKGNYRYARGAIAKAKGE